MAEKNALRTAAGAGGEQNGGGILRRAASLGAGCGRLRITCLRPKKDPLPRTGRISILLEQFHKHGRDGCVVQHDEAAHAALASHVA